MEQKFYSENNYYIFAILLLFRKIFLPLRTITTLKKSTNIAFIIFILFFYIFNTDCYATLLSEPTSPSRIHGSFLKKKWDSEHNIRNSIQTLKQESRKTERSKAEKETGLDPEPRKIDQYINQLEELSTYFIEQEKTGKDARRTRGLSIFLDLCHRKVTTHGTSDTTKKVLLLAASALKTCKREPEPTRLSPHSFTVLLGLDSRWLAFINEYINNCKHDKLTSFERETVFGQKLFEKDPFSFSSFQTYTNNLFVHIKTRTPLDFDSITKMPRPHSKRLIPSWATGKKSPQRLQEKANKELKFLQCFAKAIDHKTTETSAILGIPSIGTYFKQYLMMTMLDSVCGKIETSEDWQTSVIEGLTRALADFDGILSRIPDVTLNKGIKKGSAGVFFDKTLELPYIMLQTQHLKERSYQLALYSQESESALDFENIPSLINQCEIPKKNVYQRTIELLSLSLLLVQSQQILELTKKINNQTMIPGGDSLFRNFEVLHTQLPAVVRQLSGSPHLHTEEFDIESYLEFLGDLVRTKYLIQQIKRLYLLTERKNLPGYFHWRNRTDIQRWHDDLLNSVNSTVRRLLKPDVQKLKHLSQWQDVLSTWIKILLNCEEKLCAIAKNNKHSPVHIRTVVQLMHRVSQEDSQDQYNNREKEIIELRKINQPVEPPKMTKKTKTNKPDGGDDEDSLPQVHGQTSKQALKTAPPYDKEKRAADLKHATHSTDFFRAYVYLKRAQERFLEAPQFQLNDLEYTDLDTPVSFIFRIPQKLAHATSTLSSIESIEQELHEWKLVDIKNFIKKVRPVKSSKNYMAPNAITRTDHDKKPIEPIPETNSFICTYEHAKSLQLLQLYTLRALDIELDSIEPDSKAIQKLKQSIRELVAEVITFDQSNQHNKEYKITTPFHIISSFVRCLHVSDTEKSEALDELLTYQTLKSGAHPQHQRNLQHIKTILTRYAQNKNAEALKSWSLFYRALDKYHFWLRRLVTSPYFTLESAPNKEWLTVLYETYSLAGYSHKQVWQIQAVTLDPSNAPVMQDPITFPERLAQDSTNQPFECDAYEGHDHTQECASTALYHTTPDTVATEEKCPLAPRKDHEVQAHTIDDVSSEHNDEETVIAYLEDMLKRLQHDFNNSTGSHLAKRIIKNNEHPLLRSGEKTLLETMREPTAIDLFEQILDALKLQADHQPYEFDRNLAQSLEALKAWSNPGIINELAAFKDRTIKRIEDMSNYTLSALLTGMVANALYLKATKESYDFTDDIAEKVMEMANFLAPSATSTIPEQMRLDIPDCESRSSTQRGFCTFISEMDSMMQSLNTDVQSRLYYNPGHATQYRVTPGATKNGLIPGNIVTTTFVSIFGIVSVMTGVKPQEEVTRVLELSERLLLVLGRLPASNIEQTLADFLGCPVEEIYQATTCEACLDCCSGFARINQCCQHQCSYAANGLACMGCTLCQGLYLGLEGCKNIGPLPCIRKLLQVSCGACSKAGKYLEKIGDKSTLKCGEKCCSIPSAFCSIVEGFGSCCGGCAKSCKQSSPRCCKLRSEAFNTNPSSMYQRFCSHCLTGNCLLPCLCSPTVRCVPNRAHSYNDTVKYRMQASTTRIVHSLFKNLFYDLLKPTIDCSVRNIANLIEGLYLLVADFEIATSVKNAIVDDMRACDQHFDLHEALANLGESGGQTINSANFKALKRVFGEKAVNRVFSKATITSDTPEDEEIHSGSPAASKERISCCSSKPEPKDQQSGLPTSQLDIKPIEDAKWCCGVCPHGDLCRAIFCQGCGAILNITAWGVEAYNKIKYVLAPCMSVHKHLGSMLSRAVCCRGKKNLSRAQATSLLKEKYEQGQLPKGHFDKLALELEKLQPPYSEEMLSILEFKLNRDETDKYFCGCKMPSVFGVTIPAKMLITALSKGSDNLGQICTNCGSRAELHRRATNATMVAEGVSGSWKDMLTGASNRAAIILGNKIIQTLSGSLDAIDTPIKEQIVAFFQDKDLTMLPPALYHFVVQMAEMCQQDYSQAADHILKNNPVALQVEQLEHKALLSVTLGQDGLDSITRFIKSEVTKIEQEFNTHFPIYPLASPENLIEVFKTILLDSPVNNPPIYPKDMEGIESAIRSQIGELNEKLFSGENYSASCQTAEAIIETINRSSQTLKNLLVDSDDLCGPLVKVLQDKKTPLQMELENRNLTAAMGVNFADYLQKKQAYLHKKTKGFMHAISTLETETIPVQTSQPVATTDEHNRPEDSALTAPQIKNQDIMMTPTPPSPMEIPPDDRLAEGMVRLALDNPAESSEREHSSMESTESIQQTSHSSVASLEEDNTPPEIDIDCRRAQLEQHLQQAIEIFESYDPWEVKVTELFKELKAMSEFEDLFFEVLTDTDALKVLRSSLQNQNSATHCHQEAKRLDGVNPKLSAQPIEAY